MKPIYLLLITLISVQGFCQSTFQKKVEDQPIANRNSVLVPITASIGYQGYEETQEYFGEGEYEIFYDTGNQVLDNPIIVVDGFDPGDSRDINGLYNSLSFGGDNMADILRSEGYDIVILNAPQYTTGGKDIDGGADYIQRNAMVLVELINEINNQKTGDEELVVLGPSMGGLIARYALTYMEANSVDPQTRLYISFDSPHLGANIPISLQYLINYLAESFGDVNAQAIVANVLNSPAAKEMLIDHLLGHLLSGSTFEQDPSLLLPLGAPDFRDAFQAELDALGFPTSVRNVSMVNGSGIGTTTGTPGMQVVDTNLDIGAGITTDVTLHFTPEASQTNQAARVQTFLAGVPVALFTADAESASTSDGVDSAPGGISSISTALGDGGGNQVIIDFIAALDQDEYNFIPVISALAIENEDDWFAVPDIGGTHTSPFVNTHIPDENEFHTEITQDGAQFALDEIRDGDLGTNSLELVSKYELENNPVGTHIVLKMNSSTFNGSLEVTVFSLAGQQVMRSALENPQGQISLKHGLASGVYILNIKDQDGIYNLKFLVK